MLVSVIIPTYNRPKFTREAIASVEAQSFRDFEIIVIEDKEQKGPAYARNFGAKKAKGKYLAFLDSDDLWVKDKLEKQLRFLRDNPALNLSARAHGSGPEYKICYTDEKWVRNGQHLNQMKKHQKYHGWIFDKCLPLCIISASSILMSKVVFDDLGGFDESLPVCEDYDLWLRMAAKYPIGFLDERLIIKRGGHADQLSKKYWGMDRFRIRALEKHRGPLVKIELRRKYAVLISGSWKRRKYFRWLFYKLKSIISLR